MWGKTTSRNSLHEAQKLGPIPTWRMHTLLQGGIESTPRRWNLVEIPLSLVAMMLFMYLLHVCGDVSNPKKVFKGYKQQAASWGS